MADAADPPPSFPAQEPPTLPAPSILERRVVGHSLGVLLLFTGAGSAVLSVLKHGKWTRPQVYLTLAGGIGSFCYGIYWLRKGYYRDPAAVKQYREFFLKQGIAASIRKYEWDGLRQFITDLELTAKFEQEIGNRSFKAVWGMYGSNTLTQAVRNNVLKTPYLRARFMSLFDNSSADSLNGAAALEALRAFGDFGVNVLKVDSGWIRAATRTDPAFRKLKWADFVKNDIPFLVKHELVERSDVSAKFFEEAQQNNATFETFFKRDKTAFMYLVDASIVKPSALSALFQRTRDSHSFIEIIDLFWEWPLRPYGAEIMPKIEFDKLRILQKEMEEFKIQNQRQLEQIEQAFSNTVSNAETAFQRALSTAERLGPGKAERAAREAKAVRDDAVSIAENVRNGRRTEVQAKLAQARIRWNKEWAEWLLAREERKEDRLYAPQGGAGAAQASASSSNSSNNANNNNINIVLNIPGLPVQQVPAASPPSVSALPHVDAQPLPMQPIPVPQQESSPVVMQSQPWSPPYNPAAMVPPEP